MMLHLPSCASLAILSVHSVNFSVVHVTQSSSGHTHIMQASVRDALTCVWKYKSFLYGLTFSFAIFHDAQFYVQQVKCPLYKLIQYYLLNVLKAKTGVQNCVAGENLRIDLSGLSKNDATLHFSSQYYNLTLVERGSPVGNLHAEYLGRITLTSTGIDILNVNVSDVGNYTLTDRLNREVKIISMVLVGEFLLGISESFQK